MAIIPLEDRVLIEIYRCPVCNKNWMETPKSRTFRCGVNHPPGTCCHYFEEEVSREQLGQIYQILKIDFHICADTITANRISTDKI